MELLPVDIVEYICGDMLTRDAMALFLTCRCYMSLSTPEYWARVALLRHGATFWVRSFRRVARPAFTSLPYELHRIEYFQRNLVRHSYPMWTDREFFAYWDAMDQCKVLARRARSADAAYALARRIH